LTSIAFADKRANGWWLLPKISCHSQRPLTKGSLEGVQTGDMVNTCSETW
jgi:hypothetical protein